MCSHTHLFEFKVSDTLFQNEAELIAVKQRIQENLKDYGFTILNTDPSCAGPGFLQIFTKEGKGP